ncbi:DMT family transporter [Desulfosporosinus nitroreducens]|uniref:DMT family transporter n=1 Tax=Desulfosporosinus nitroreducens TaxID=2018668 RepID=A0ABT8QKN5_9FIRM|nr:DMT family transporter [Desulfosporosinus nitroreducens]MCO1600867.1 DMT family transporter [Desulfosporosinus nitroreducens]MDO0821902.1 DMT family transporter [Desulfosporosinus nitroreducens]
MYLDWFQLVLIYIVTNSASKVIQKQVLKDQEVDPAAFSAFFLFVVGVLSIPLLMVEKPSIASSPELWLVVILSSVFYMVCMFLYYNALKSTEVSQVETIATTRSIWFLVFGIFLFGESVNLSSFLGIALIFGGLIVIYWDKGSFKDFGKPHLYTLIYSLLISASYALDKIALNSFSVVLYQVVVYIIPAIFTVIFIPKTFGNLRYFIKPQKSTLIVLISAVFQMISTLALYAAYKYGGDLSVVGPLAQTSTVLTIIVGIVILKERWNLKRKIIGVILVLVGVALLKLSV